MKNVTYINASAGSGKTYTLTHTLADLISDKKVRPEQVIMTTFTVKAASEMAPQVQTLTSTIDELQALTDKGQVVDAGRKKRIGNLEILRLQGIGHPDIDLVPVVDDQERRIGKQKPLVVDRRLHAVVAD